MRAIFPEAWRDFAEHLPADERGDLLGHYYRRLTDAIPTCTARRRARGAATRRPARRCYPTARAPFESDHGGFALGARRASRPTTSATTPSCREGWPWNDLGKRAHLPCTIVQGRYDIVCPPVTRRALSRAWPEARFVIVPDAGHSALEPGIRAALVNATESHRLSVADEELFAPRFPWEAA